MYFEQVVITAVSRSEDWWKLLATGRPGFRGTCAVLWRSWACLARAGSCAVSEKYRGCSNQAAAAQQNHTANRVIKTVAVVFGCHHIRCRTNSSASRSEDWWKLLATGRPGFRGTCAVLRGERDNAPRNGNPRIRGNSIVPVPFTRAGKLSRPPALQQVFQSSSTTGRHGHTQHTCTHADRTWERNWVCVKLARQLLIIFCHNCKA